MTTDAPPYANCVGIVPALIAGAAMQDCGMPGAPDRGRVAP